MPFQVPASKASIKQNCFEFSFPGSKRVYSVPLIKYLKPELALRFDELTETQAIKELFESVMPGQNLLAKFDDGDQLEAWILAWKNASGIDLGESEASADS